MGLSVRHTSTAGTRIGSRSEASSRTSLYNIYLSEYFEAQFTQGILHFTDKPIMS
jgi:hypothetical protein